MEQTNKSVAIIPARTNSQGIINKNIKEFAGIPLIAHTIKHAQESNLFQDIIVSTDSEEYMEIAKKHGASVPFLRPPHLARYTVPTSEVTLHVLQTLQQQGIKYNSFAVLQPTSPLRTMKNLQESYSMLIEKNADIIISVCRAHHHPQWFNTLPENLSLNGFISKEIRNKPRQQLKTYYSIHGAIFWAQTDAYLAKQDPYDMNTYAYIMSQEESVDIDTINEFILAETIYNTLIKNKK